MLESLKSAYAVFEQLNISVTGLIVIAIVLALAFLFSVREAATWFFKVDDLKRDIGRLKEIAGQMDGQIRVLQKLIGELRESKSFAAEPAAPLAAVAAVREFELTPTEIKPAPKTTPGTFPIIH